MPCTLSTSCTISWRSIILFQRKRSPYYRRYLDITPYIAKSLHNDLRGIHSIILGFMIFQTQLCVNATNYHKGLTWHKLDLSIIFSFNSRNFCNISIQASKWNWNNYCVPYCGLFYGHILLWLLMAIYWDNLKILIFWN